jgi:nucleoid-associated protein YgaU
MRGIVRIAGAVLLIAAGVAGLTGCSKTSGRTVNVKAGEYYSEDEFATLSNSQKRAYCSALQAERDRLQAAVDDHQEQLASTKKRIESLRNQIAPVEKEILRTESDIRTLTSEINQFEALPKVWTVQAGDCLSTIAERDEIYADWTKWPRIYRANLDKIEDPVWIYPGEQLTIPRDLPTEHRVEEYETLEMIAGYWEVYNDPTQWVRLLDANKGKVKDPNNLEPGTILVIPR